MSNPTLEVLVSQEQIFAKTLEMAQAINHRVPDDGEPIILLGILKGSVHFLSDLARALSNLNRECCLEFMQVSSWHGATSSSGEVQIKKDLDSPIVDRNVVIVEDILDTGRTLAHLSEVLATRKPKSLHICALLSKPDARIIEINTDLIGFEIPNKFVVGYGLDYDERYRNLPYVAVYHPSNKA
jgi:hypoxanthine phosphoribosyltransferase